MKAWFSLPLSLLMLAGCGELPLEMAPDLARAQSTPPSLFQTVDKNHDGALSARELLEGDVAVWHESLHPMWGLYSDDHVHALDLNQDGQLDEAEFEQYVAAMADKGNVVGTFPVYYQLQTKQELDEAFQRADQNGDGVLQLSEFPFTVKHAVPNTRVTKVVMWPDALFPLGDVNHDQALTPQEFKTLHQVTGFSLWG